MEIIQYILSGFWRFFGFLVLFILSINFLFKCWSRVWRHMNIRKHGWPPSHLDADGDFKEIS